MSASPDGGRISSAGPHREYKLVSATFRDKAYPNGVLLIDEARREVELRQWIGMRKKKQATIARFPLQADADVLVEGALLRFSGLSIVLESPASAEEVAEFLRLPVREREAMEALAEAESALTEFLASREQAVDFLTRLKANPREALLGAESLWPPDDERRPLDAVYSGFSARLAVALEKLKSSIAGGEKKLGPQATERVYALAYTVGAIQDALLEGDFKQDQELAALQELGVAATTQDLRAEKPTERILSRAHPVLAGLVVPPRPTES